MSSDDHTKGHPCLSGEALEGYCERRLINQIHSLILKAYKDFDGGIDEIVRATGWSEIEVRNLLSSAGFITLEKAVRLGLALSIRFEVTSVAIGDQSHVENP